MSLPLKLGDLLSPHPLPLRWVAYQFNTHAGRSPHLPFFLELHGLAVRTVLLTTLEVTVHEKGMQRLEFSGGVEEQANEEGIFQGMKNSSVLLLLPPWTCERKRKIVKGCRDWSLDVFPVCLAYFGDIQGTECHRVAAHQPDASDTRDECQEEAGR